MRQAVFDIKKKPSDTPDNFSKELEKEIQKINPLVPVELVIDHSIQVDVSGTKDSLKRNEQIEFERNKERFELLKWGQKNL